MNIRHAGYYAFNFSKAFGCGWCVVVETDHQMRLTSLYPGLDDNEISY